MVFNLRRDSLPGGFLQVGNGCEGDLVFRRVGQEGAGKNVGRVLLGAGCQVEEAFRRDLSGGDDLANGQVAVGDGPRLIKGPGPGAGKCFEDTSCFDNDPVP